MKRILTSLPFLLLLASCEMQAEEASDTGDNPDAVSFDEFGNARVTKTYYVSNPTSSGCANALRLTAKGTGITEIKPSGCMLNGNTWRIPSWDSLTSAGTTQLSDTWYVRSSAFDKDYTSASSEAWCGPSNQVTVKVTGTTVTSLTYWFTDDQDCYF